MGGRPPWVHRVCSECGEDVPRDEQLYAKSATWREVNPDRQRGHKYAKSRTTAYQCRACAERDPDWSRRPYDESPGFKLQEPSAWQELLDRQARERAALLDKEGAGADAAAQT